MKSINPKIVFALISLLYLQIANSWAQPVVKNGIIHISHNDLTTYGVIPLQGQWEFYMNHFYTTTDFALPNNTSHKDSITVPGFWNDKNNNTNIPQGFGYATYRARIVFTDSTPDYLFIIENRYSSASKLFINGKYISSSGNISTSASSFKPDICYQTVHFKTLDTTEIILHIANFSNLRGGIFKSPEIGTQYEIIQKYEHADYWTFFILGITAILTFLFFIFWTINHKQTEYLYSAIFGFLVFLRQSTIEQCVLNKFDIFSYSTLLFISFASSFLLITFIVLYINRIFPFQKLIWLKNTIIISTTTFFIISTILSHYYYKFLITPFILLTGITVIYLTYNQITYTIKKEKGAVYYLWALVICIVIFIYESFISLEYTNNRSITSFAVLILFIAQAIVLSIRVSNTLKENTILNNNLKTLNQNLEDKITEQTIEIKNKNKILEQQTQNLQQNNQQLIELLRFKENTTEMIVHDLKSPLNNLLILLEKKSIVEVKEKANTLISRLYVIINNMLDIQKIENTSIKLTLQYFSLNQCMNEAIEVCISYFETKNITVVNHCDYDFIIYSDKLLLLRVFENLLTNAAKYSPQNNTVTIQTKHDSQNQTVTITIIDNGEGITAKEQAKIFDKYYSSHFQKSTGLGLTFCKLAIEALNGSIGVVSEKNKGSQFWVNITYTQIQTLHKTITAKQTSQDFTLSQQALLQIAPTIEKLKKLKFYEISSIHRVLNQIENSDNELTTWKNAVAEAAKNSNELLYKKLIGNE